LVLLQVCEVARYPTLGVTAVFSTESDTMVG
jgi:hypothetical protein